VIGFVSARVFTSVSENGFATSSAAAATSGVSGATNRVVSLAGAIAGSLTVASMLSVSDGASLSTAWATADFSM